LHIEFLKEQKYNRRIKVINDIIDESDENGDSMLSND
jgi:hypothetical protein